MQLQTNYNPFFYDFIFVEKNNLFPGFNFFTLQIYGF